MKLLVQYASHLSKLAITSWQSQSLAKTIQNQKHLSQPDLTTSLLLETGHHVLPATQSPPPPPITLHTHPISPPPTDTLTPTSNNAHQSLMKPSQTDHHSYHKLTFPKVLVGQGQLLPCQSITTRN